MSQIIDNQDGSVGVTQDTTEKPTNSSGWDWNRFIDSAGNVAVGLFGNQNTQRPAQGGPAFVSQGSSNNSTAIIIAAVVITIGILAVVLITRKK